MSKYLQYQQAMERTLEDNAFIAGVYRLLVLSLIAGAAGAWVGLQTGITAQYFWQVMGANVIALIFAAIVQKIRGVNFLALFAFAGISGLSLSIPLGMMIAKGYGEVIIPGFALTAGLFTLLSIYVHLKGSDFSCMGGFLFAGLCVAVAGWCFNAFFPFAVPMQVLGWSCLGVLLFAGWVLFDTSVLINHLGPDDTVQGALSLYLDIFNMLFNLLRAVLEMFANSSSGMDWDFGFDFFSFFDFF
ncbi:MAG: Bax inhibitor-1 family protein [Alphaproteobacteria bacterium]